VIGVAIGAIARLPGAAPLLRVVAACEALGTAFIRLITMVVIPLVVSSLFVGVASLGDVRRLGRVGGRTLLYFLATTFVAASIGLSLALAAGLGSGVSAAGVQTAAGVESRPDLVQMLVNMLPQNPIASAAQGDLMPLIIAVCIFGAAATVTRSDARRTVTAFFEGIYEFDDRDRLDDAPRAGFVLILIASVVARRAPTCCKGC
jgi:Na+/H+-dicarboxylate symporter